MKALLASVTSSLWLFAACSTDGRALFVSDAAAPTDAREAHAEVDASEPVDVDEGARCVATLGTALTAPYGRLDGTVIAIVEPGRTGCGQENGDDAVA